MQNNCKTTQRDLWNWESFRISRGESITDKTAEKRSFEGSQSVCSFKSSNILARRSNTIFSIACSDGWAFQQPIRLFWNIFVQYGLSSTQVSPSYSIWIYQITVKPSPGEWKKNWSTFLRIPSRISCAEIADSQICFPNWLASERFPPNLKQLRWR